MAATAAGTRLTTSWGPWKVVLTFTVVLMIGVGFTLVGMWIMPTWMRLELWIAALVLLSAFAVIIGCVVNGRWSGILIDARNKVSLARFQTILWLILIISAFLAAGLSNLHITLFSTRVDALSITVPTELLALLGVSATSLVGSAFILRVKSNQCKIETRDHPNAAAWSDIFKGDDHFNCDSVDLSKVQMFYVTVILVLVYGAALAAMFIEDNGHAISTFPALSATMVTLLGISHAAYLGYKAVPHHIGQASEHPKAVSHYVNQPPEPSKVSANQQGAETNHPE